MKALKGWQDVATNLPGVDRLYWAWDIWYEEIHLAEWDGECFDREGFPMLRSLTKKGDDYNLRFYCQCKQPKPPRVIKGNLMRDPKADGWGGQPDR